MTQLPPDALSGVGAIEEELAILYLRVSDPRQTATATDIDPHGLSIATQREVGTQRADALGARVVKEFIEPGISAQSIEKRKAFREMLVYLTEHPEVRYVIVYMRSRAFRNYREAVITRMALDKLDVRLISVKEDFGEGDEAEAMEAITDIFNWLANRKSGRDIRDKMGHKAMNGGTIGAVPIGYLNVRKEVDGRQINTVEVDPERAPLVLQAWELFATGDYSPERLEAVMADAGLTSRARPTRPGKPVAAEQWRRLLRKPYYAGWIEYRAKLYRGRHPAIVSQALFDRVQDVLDSRSARGQRDRKHEHYLRGGLFCDRCRRNGRTSRLIYSAPKGRHGETYEYFVCRARLEKRCDLPHLPVAKVEDAVLRHHASLRLPADFAAAISKGLESTLADQQRSTRELHTRLKERLRKLDQSEERLLDLALEAAMPQARIRNRLNKIQQERRSVEERLGDTERQLDVGAGILRSSLRLLDDPQALYQHAPDKIRRRLNQAIYTAFYLDKHGEVTDSTLKAPFDEIYEANLAAQHTRPTAQVIALDNARGPSAKTGTSETLTGLHLRDLFRVTVSNKTVMVDLATVEAAVSLERIALDLLTQQAAVDPDRLGVVGHSWGATQAAILSGVEPRLAAVVVAATGARYAEFAWSLHDRPARKRAAYLEVVGRADPIHHLVQEGRRTLLLQFGRQDRIPRAEVKELWQVAAGDKELAEFECGHDLVNHAPARLSRLAFLHRALRI